MFIKKGEDVYRAEIEPAAPDASNADPEYSKGVQALTTTTAVNRKYLMTRRFAIREVETAQERRQNQKKQKNKN